MIVLNNTSVTARIRTYLATKDTVQAIEKLKIDLSNCSSFSQCFDCSWLVLANSDDYSDELTNDKSSFILKIQNSQTIEVKITNTDTNTDYITTDNTYGNYYAVGDLKANVFGYVVDWAKVAQSISFGNYKIRISVLNVSLDEVYYEEKCFKLRKFSCGISDSTVRIDFYKIGYIQNGFNYQDLNINNGYWIDQYRFSGNIQFENHTTEVDNVVSSYRSFVNVQTQLKENFNLNLTGINDSRFNILFKESMLYPMEIIGYSLSSIRKLGSRFYQLVSIDEPIKHKVNGTYTFNVKLTYSNQSTIKRQY